MVRIAFTGGSIQARVPQAERSVQVSKNNESSDDSMTPSIQAPRGSESPRVAPKFVRTHELWYDQRRIMKDQISFPILSNKDAQ